ncbi:uncharacterized protein LOC105764088 [Gossypium raimondii]|uniref:Uncharacterized protein n=1 Tax=Gossypium raimondii TaxID=29730 RepID=A0A0D2T0D8_GOSRA|nr:uncharacterized protein LOC105764088 [Gossypium raimondii]KJB49864.1 hypothetical protein B456_008G142600 [Gossypium raimondii]
MEGISATMYKNLKGYWQRRGYIKLNGTKGGGRRSKVELGSSRRRRFWKIRVKAKLRLPSPKKFFVWLRDAYVKMMLGLANSRMVSTGYGGAMGDHHGIAALGKRPVKEYDEKMIVEIYKSLVMAQGQLVPREAGKLRSAIICQR